MSALDASDVVIIDCQRSPSGIGISLNGLQKSNGFVIPTIPDGLSTYGITQMPKQVEEFSKEIGENIHLVWNCITKHQANSTVHRGTVKQLRVNGSPSRD